MNRLHLYLLVIGLVIQKAAGVSYRNTTVLNSGGTWAVSVCGAGTMAACSSTEIYYWITTTRQLNIYWMDSSQVPTFLRSPSNFTGYDYTRSCIQVTSCPKNWLTGVDPDKTLAVYNPGGTSATVSINLQTRQASTSDGGLSAWVIALIVIAGVGAIVIGVGYWWRRRIVVVDAYGSLEGR